MEIGGVCVRIVKLDSESYEYASPTGHWARFSRSGLLTDMHPESSSLDVERGRELLRKRIELDELRVRLANVRGERRQVIQRHGGSEHVPDGHWAEYLEAINQLGERIYFLEEELS